MSHHECPVTTIKLEKHPDADALSIVRIDGWQVIVRTDEWQDGDLATFVPPDYVVPDTEQFAFLKGHRRIKVRKYRGLYSQGLLIKPPHGLNVGDNAMETLDIIRYEPPIPMSSGGQDTRGPSGVYVKYDVENFYRYPNIIYPTQQVLITEKIHGTNARFVWTHSSESDEPKMYCGSRTRWKVDDDKNWWWLALRQNPWIEEWCRAHPDLCLYGEIFGNVQELKYGAKPNQLMFRFFDIWDGCIWKDRFNSPELDELAEYMVPTLYYGPFILEKAIELSEGDSVIEGANHMREGIVIRPIPHAFHKKFNGRVQLKIVSNRYLAKGK